MNFRENLRNISFYVVLGIILIIIGVFIYRSSKNKSVQIIPNPSPVATLVLPLSTTYAKVTRVIDGDTVVIDTGQKVRYIGLNTPEIETKECFANEAGEINKNLVLGKTIKLEKDVSDVDKYGRLLRYVYLDNEMINTKLVKYGDAKVMTVSPDIKYKNEFLQSEKYAKENNLGLWRKCER